MAQSSYKYITNTDFSTDFYSEEEEITVSLCVYNINTNCFIETMTVKDIDKHLNEDIKKKDFDLNTLLKTGGPSNKTSLICPFVEFIFTNKNNQYEFPSFTFQPINVTSKTVPKKMGGFAVEREYDIFDIDDDDIDYPYGNTTYFENECFLQLFKLFKTTPHETHLSNVNDMYNGFIQIDKTHYTVFFNISLFLLSAKDIMKEDYIFGILDEIMYKKKIWDTPIDKSVIKLFKKNKRLRSIKNQKEIEYPIPLQTYMCEKKNDQYMEKRNTLFPSNIEPFGLCYYMSNDPLTKKQPRFAMFVTNCLYNIELKEYSEISVANKKGEHKELSDENLSNALLTNSSFYFNDNDIQIWGIRDNLHLTKLK